MLTILSFSSGITRLYTVAMLASSSAYVLTRMTTNWPTWRRFISLLRSSVCNALVLIQTLLTYVNTDSFFDNVCELDLVFNFYKVRHFYPLTSLHICGHAQGLRDPGRNFSGRG